MVTISDIFVQVFKDSSLSSEEVKKYADQFASVAFLAVLGASEEKLNEAEKEIIKSSINEQNYQGSIEFLSKKYSPEEWESLLEREVKPLLANYREHLGV